MSDDPLAGDDAAAAEIEIAVPMNDCLSPAFISGMDPAFTSASMLAEGGKGERQ